jgi:hypothetical protein
MSDETFYPCCEHRVVRACNGDHVHWWPCTMLDGSSLCAGSKPLGSPVGPTT